MYNKLITNITPPGFTWETGDAFLFCVHHLYKIPRGNEIMAVANTIPEPAVIALKIR